MSYGPHPPPNAKSAFKAASEALTKFGEHETPGVAAYGELEKADTRAQEVLRKIRSKQIPIPDNIDAATAPAWHTDDRDRHDARMGGNSGINSYYLNTIGTDQAKKRLLDNHPEKWHSYRELERLIESNKHGHGMPAQHTAAQTQAEFLLGGLAHSGADQWAMTYGLPPRWGPGSTSNQNSYQRPMTQQGNANGQSSPAVEIDPSTGVPRRGYQASAPGQHPYQRSQEVFSGGIGSNGYSNLTQQPPTDLNPNAAGYVSNRQPYNS